MKNKKRPKIERDGRKMNVIKGTFGYLVNFYKMCLYSIVIIPVVIGYSINLFCTCLALFICSVFLANILFQAAKDVYPDFPAYYESRP